MFDRVFVINLDRRPDRLKRFWANFPTDWPWRSVVRWPAKDGRELSVPDWYGAHAGAWGCHQTHIAIWWQQFLEEWDSVLIIEDDAIFARSAIATIRRTMEIVPDDWDQIYFGGQHLHPQKFAPKVVVQDELVRGYRVGRTHCYAMRRKFAMQVIDALDRPSTSKDGRSHHIDHRLCGMHETGEYMIYAPWRFCVGQMNGESDVRRHKKHPRGQYMREHWWNQFPIVEAK